MKTSCLINNFNYADYVCEAIQSVLDQTQLVDQIVVVDDGSTDRSCTRIEAEFGSLERVVLIRKSNAGQLSCFNRGMREVSGDVVFFLDADDRYRPDYVSRAVSVFKQHSTVDFLTVADQQTGPNAVPPSSLPSRDLGLSTLAALLDRKWVGGVTSSLSMRTALARQILPCALESEWRTRADDVLVFGASILGAHKYYLGAPLIEYRLHGRNCFAGQRFTAVQQMRYALAVNQLIAWYGQRAGLDANRLPPLLHREFRTIERPSLREWINYFSLTWRQRTPWSLRVRQSFALTAHAIGQRRKAAPRKRCVSPSPAQIQRSPVGVSASSPSG
ncbi:MAG: glycosyltransferase family 2 protein [Planctomycetaceae bacterium]|nr:glycosyltransferase family 2 protein [Planctomycetaceae bacterium]